MFGEALIVMRSLGKHDESMDEIRAELRWMKAMKAMKQIDQYHIESCKADGMPQDRCGINNKSGT